MSIIKSCFIPSIDYPFFANSQLGCSVKTVHEILMETFVFENAEFSKISHGITLILQKDFFLPGLFGLERPH